MILLPAFSNPKWTFQCNLTTLDMKVFSSGLEWEQILKRCNRVVRGSSLLLPGVKSPLQEWMIPSLFPFAQRNIADTFTDPIIAWFRQSWIPSWMEDSLLSFSPAPKEVYSKPCNHILNSIFPTMPGCGAAPKLSAL